MIAAGFPAAVTELQQDFAVGLRFEPEFRRVAAVAFPLHERRRRQLLEAHLKHNRVLLETEDGLSSGVSVHLHVGGPPTLDAVLGDGGAMPMRWM